jgi:hypothetical protein
MQTVGKGVCVGGVLYAVPSDAEIDAAAEWVGPRRSSGMLASYQLSRMARCA